MKRVAQALSVTLVYVLAVVTAVYAAGGDSTSPFFVKRWQGKCVKHFSVSCTTAGDVVAVTAAQMAGALSVEFTNNDATNPVIICPRAGGPAQCDAATKGKRLPASQSWPVDIAVVDQAFSCMGVGGTVVVGVLIESTGDPNTNRCQAPTPTPIATYTPTPAPT